MTETKLGFKSGTIVAGAYRADELIGAGGMGAVWSGVRLADNEPVAIKTLLSTGSEERECVARFRREAQVLARVNSEYVARVFDFITDGDDMFLILELIDGESLQSVLSNRVAISIEETLDIAADVLRGLCDLHNANIVHRDLKPGNIVMRPRPGTRPRATIIDFGVSRVIADRNEDDSSDELTQITRGDRVLGTVEYMAPEQVLGSMTVTTSADLYALGAMMFRAITGHHVYGDLFDAQLAVAKMSVDAPRIATRRVDDAARRTVDLVARLLSRSVSQRFHSAADALREVQSIRKLARRTVPAVTPLPAHAADENSEPNSSSDTTHEMPTLVRSKRAGVSVSRRDAKIVAALLVITGLTIGALAGTSFNHKGVAYRLLTMSTTP